MIYLHGGGFIVGSLDQFETAMRLFAEGSGGPGPDMAVGTSLSPWEAAATSMC
jgi:hypothetical protein